MKHKTPVLPKSHAKAHPQGTASALRRRAEAHLTARAETAPPDKANPQEMLHELQVHQVELEMQNDELTAARNEAEIALARYAHLYDFAPIGYFTLGRDGTIHRTNIAGASLLGSTRSRLHHRRFGQYVATSDRLAFADFLERVFSSPHQKAHEMQCEITLLAPVGMRPRALHLNATLDAKTEECRLVASDVTERKDSEARRELAASVFTHAQEGIMIMEADGRIIETNRSFTDITGVARDEALGQTASILVSGCQEPEFYARMWADLKARGHWRGEMWDRRKNGELYAVMLKINAVRNAAGAAQHYVALFSDITALKEHQTRLERMAHFDALTGLPNRVLLADRLQHALAQTRRRENFMALVYLDLDGFKAINDVHGHETGDELLVVVAQRLKDALREGDTLARLGGDEFVAVLADLETTAECEVILSRLLQAAASPVHIRDHVLTVSASLGVTLSPQDNSDAEVLLRHADQAMYLAKQAGKNRFHMFDPELDLHARTHRESLQQIAQALERGEFIVYFQPKVNMRSGRAIGAEALIRWQHPERGLLLPDEFLAAIENHGLISLIGEWVLDVTLDQIAAWQKEGLVMPVSVNIAAYHLAQEDFLSRVREKLRAHPGLLPDLLEFEVLETAALADIGRISRVMSACHALGVEFSLDDFGTGYSSLTYLKRLPASTLKIDQSFVRNMLWDKEDLAIVEGIIGLATAFGRHVIAEGVETIDHAKLLIRLGCDRAQGTYFAAPMPAERFSSWVHHWRTDPALQIDCEALPSTDNLSLAYAEVDHRQWIRRLEGMLQGAIDSMTPVPAGKCQFGQWHGDDGAIRYSHLPEFQSIAAVHGQLHVLAKDLITLHGAGRHDEAHKRLAELQTLRDQYIDSLRRLSVAISVSGSHPGTRAGARKASIPLL